ncbi:MAG: hypothetical protein HKN50_02005 [Gammaproteobacteria bacterium]|nr:hypothetical protein [Gammaproteobacteria bacterium]
MSINFKKGCTPALLVGVLLLSACARTIVVTGDVPQPLIEPVPLKANLIITDELRRYRYEEKEKGRNSLKSLDFGAAQVLMFERVFDGILTLLPLDEQAVTQIDLQITPQLLEFQYSVPRETKLNLYEIWLKYRILITDPAGAEVADWVVKGYGKTPTTTLSSAVTAFNLATNIALRDVGAQLAIGFPRQPAISKMLDSSADAGEQDKQIASDVAVPGNADEVEGENTKPAIQVNDDDEPAKPSVEHEAADHDTQAEG